MDCVTIGKRSDDQNERQIIRATESGWRGGNENSHYDINTENEADPSMCKERCWWREDERQEEEWQQLFISRHAHTLSARPQNADGILMTKVVKPIKHVFKLPDGRHCCLLSLVLKSASAICNFKSEVVTMTTDNSDTGPETSSATDNFIVALYNSWEHYLKKNGT